MLASVDGLSFPPVPLQMDTSIFVEGSVLPMPSQQALKDSIGKGGNGTVTYIFHSGKEFAVKKVGLTWNWGCTQLYV